MERTQAFLDAHGVTQTELGVAIGVQGAAISRKLGGTRSWKLVEVNAALKFLSSRLRREVTFAEVFGTSCEIDGISDPSAVDIPAAPVEG